MYSLFYICTYISAFLVYQSVIILSSKTESKVIFMDKITETKIGNNIRDIRENANITQEFLATKLQLRGCDITRSAIAKIEVGQRHLYPDELILIKEILNTTFEEILKV